MALVAHATVLTLHDSQGGVPAGRLCVDGDGRIEAVLRRGTKEPIGYSTAARVHGDVVSPSLVDLHNHEPPRD